MSAASKSEWVVWRRLTGTPYKQIAEELGCSVVTCRVLLHKRRRLTRSLLASDRTIEWSEE